MGVIKMIGILLRALLANRAALAMENLALRQQLTVLERSVKRPALWQRDRIFWAWCSGPPISVPFAWRRNLFIRPHLW